MSLVLSLVDRLLNTAPTDDPDDPVEYGDIYDDIQDSILWDRNDDLYQAMGPSGLRTEIMLRFWRGRI